ncbi:MAG TPA: riboflavin synthase [Myxococcota bacterium]|nr:riboflavin synthase [Myxococcota bacterium]
MFTGIVERIARITRLEHVAGRVELEIEAGADIAKDVRLGDSIALSGTCLTVVAVRGERLAFQVVPESLRMTSLGARKSGEGLNLERAMRVDARLDGHIVQGHVDGVGTVREVRADGEDRLIRIDCAPELAEQIVPKGSIAVEGVSLTAVDPDERGFGVALIPHTRAVTTLGALTPGQAVNLELDVLGKYVFRYLARMREE